MVFNGDLDSVLHNIVNNISPVIRTLDGLYMLVDKYSIIPDENLGTNLLININEINLKLLGTWSRLNYIYNSETNKWSYTIEF